MFQTTLFRTALLVIGLLLSGISTASASDPAADLQWSVRRLNTWLGDSDQAIGWRKYLLLNVLESQAAKGHQADIGMLNQILARFAGNADGLDHPVFSDVKSAIEQQISSLSNSYYGPVAGAAAAHLGSYEPISADQVEYCRKRASHDLLVLKSFYRRAMPSRARANLFYDLQLDPMVDFINEVRVERAPEISVGKLSSMLKDKKRELREVTREIDALPDADESDDEEGDDVQLDDSDKEEPEEAGPLPDDSTPLELLTQRKEKLEAAIKELNKRRKEVLKVDRPRLKRRRDTLLEMRDYSKRFESVGKSQFDPYFVTAARSFERFIQIYASGTADNLQEDMLRRMLVLSEDLPALGQPSERRLAGRVGNLLEWFENSKQVPAMVSTIRRQYSLPNLYFNVSSNLVNQSAGQAAVETRVMDENINGRLVRGYTTTSTNVNMDFVDDPNQVHLSVHLSGCLASNTRFRERKFYGFVNANGQFEGRRSLYANIGGLFAGPTDVAANVGTNFLGLTTRSDFIQRLAYKQFGEQKAENDANAAATAEQEAFEQFDRLTGEAVASGQDAIFAANGRAVDYAAWIPDLYLRSRADFIELVGKKDSVGTLAAPNYPSASSVPADVIVRLHDSLLSNFIDPIFAGKTFTNKELAAEAAELFGETPEGLATEDGDDEGEDESFSITFDSVRPIQFEFDDNAVTIAISGKRFSQGERKIDAGLQIKVRFKIKQTADGLQLMRDGDAELDYTDPENKDAKIVAFKSFLEDKLNSEANRSNAIDLPDNLLPIERVTQENAKKIVQSLRLVQCSVQEGWLYLGWRHLPGSQGSVGYQTDLPAIWNEVVVSQFETDFSPEPNSVLTPTESAESPSPMTDSELQVQ